MRTLFWHCRDYSRDLRLHDSAGLFYSLKEKGTSSSPVRPIFIFDTEILKKLKDPSDARVTFLHDHLIEIKDECRKHGSDLWVFHGTLLKVFQSLIQKPMLEYKEACDRALRALVKALKGKKK